MVPHILQRVHYAHYERRTSTENRKRHKTMATIFESILALTNTIREVGTIESTGDGLTDYENVTLQESRNQLVMLIAAEFQSLGIAVNMDDAILASNDIRGLLSELDSNNGLERDDTTGLVTLDVANINGTSGEILLTQVFNAALTSDNPASHIQVIEEIRRMAESAGYTALVTAIDQHPQVAELASQSYASMQQVLEGQVQERIDSNQEFQVPDGNGGTRSLWAALQASEDGAVGTIIANMVDTLEHVGYLGIQGAILPADRPFTNEELMAYAIAALQHQAEYGRSSMEAHVLAGAGIRPLGSQNIDQSSILVTAPRDNRVDNAVIAALVEANPDLLKLDDATLNALAEIQVTADAADYVVGEAELQDITGIEDITVEAAQDIVSAALEALPPELLQELQASGFTLSDAETAQLVAGEQPVDVTGEEPESAMVRSA